MKVVLFCHSACHPPVCWSTAVSDTGCPTSRQPGAPPSCLMPHCIHSTSVAAGLSQSTLPFVPDTAVMKAHGEGRPAEKMHQRECEPCPHLLRCTTRVLCLAPGLPPPCFLSQNHCISPYLHFSASNLMAQRRTDITGTTPTLAPTSGHQPRQPH